MPSTAHLDSRAVPLFLSEAGVPAQAVLEIRAIIAAQLTGRTSGPVTRTLECKDIIASITLEAVWDGICVTTDKVDERLSKLLERYAQTFDPRIQEKLQNDTVNALADLVAMLRKLGTNIEDLRAGARQITQPIARGLLEFHANSISRVIHEEIAGFLTKPVREKSMRILLGHYLLAQFPVPMKRTYRFVLCQALENLAEPELCEGLAKLTLDPQYASLRGKLCEALVKCGHLDAPRHIAAVLSSNADDETRLCAIEALGALKADEYADLIRAQLKYESSDKDWTRTIQKAAAKVLKTL
ncbi:MAG TPA: hypothetical protein VKX17_15505 [Planctomycetota bacterium]|nr:hypothetical protein [Planctomycetota bacterium]